MSVFGYNDATDSGRQHRASCGAAQLAGSEGEASPADLVTRRALLLRCPYADVFIDQEGSDETQLRVGRSGCQIEPERGERDGQRGETRHLHDLMSCPRHLERVPALTEAKAFEPARLRVHDPVVRHSARRVALRLHCPVVVSAMRRDDLDEEKRGALDAAAGSLRRIADHHEVRLHHVVLGQDHIEGGIEHLAPPALLEEAEEDREQALGDMLVLEAWRRRDVELAPQELVAPAIIAATLTPLNDP